MINQPFSFKSLPPAIRGLIVVNCAIFLLQWAVGPSMTSYLGLVPAHVLQDLWLWQIFTYMFLHAGIFHLLFNMFVLWTFGREMENMWGSLSFLWYYLLCGWGAGVCNVLFTPTSTYPSIGASGSIYGLLVAFAVLFPQSVLYMYFVIPMRAKHAVMLFVAIEFLAGFSGAGSGRANFAHLGGMLTGYIYLKSGSWRFPNLSLSGLFGKFSRRSSPASGGNSPIHDLSEEVDRILDKILKQGMESLTSEERELMRRYSKMKK